MIQDFIDSALIIDDKKDEVVELEKLLHSNDILVNTFTPDEIKGKKIKNRKIIFLDLHISKTATNDEGHISEIRRIFSDVIKNDFGIYGIVLWSAYSEKIDLLKEKIKEDFGKYSLPLFIVRLDKNKYKKAGNYDSVLTDLDTKIEENTAASFFIQWETLVKKGKDNAIQNIYSLVKDYAKQDDYLKYILYKIAENYTGVDLAKVSNYPLEPDAYKAFSDMLHYEVTNSSESVTSNIFQNIAAVISFNIQQSEKDDLYSELNSRLLIDKKNIKQEFPIPGNVYELMDTNSSFKVENIPSDATPIIIDITPPCDFSKDNKGGRSRIIGGFIYDYSAEDHKYKKEFYYKEIWPIKIEGKSKSQMIIFDFRYLGSIKDDELKNDRKYKILFRAKNKLFADILQKLSAHTARLGLSIIH